MHINQRTKPVLIELDISAIEEYVIISLLLYIDRHTFFNTRSRYIIVRETTLKPFRLLS